MSRPKSSYTLWILGHVLRGLVVLLIIGVCAFLIWRIAFSQKPPKELRRIASNEILREAYDEYGDDLIILEQPNQITYTEAANNQAYFRYDWCVFIKQANQVQLLFFYNNSTLEKLQSDYELEQEIPAGQEVFDLLLTQYVDVTPEGHEGDAVLDKREITPSSCEVGTNRNGMYTFLRYTFDGVDLTDTVVIYLDVFYEEIEESLGTLRLYHEEELSEERDLTRKEKKIIKEG